MTAFDANKFDMGYGRERYVRYDGQFVARFKYANAAAGSRHFVKFLTENFTVEEYFELLKTMPPAKVLETKGFIDYNTLQAMKRGGHATREELLDAMRVQYNLPKVA